MHKEAQQRIAQCRSNQKYTYQRLIERLSTGKKATIECRESTEDVNLLALIDHAFSEERPREVQSILEQKKKHSGATSVYYYDYSKKNVIEGNVHGRNLDMGDGVL